MDILLFSFSVIFGLLMLVLMAIAASPPMSESDASVFKTCSMILGCCVAGVMWTCLAWGNNTPPATVTYHPIEKRGDVSFYVNEKGTLVQITGDARLANPETAHYCITIIPGGWSYGVYVTESRKVEIVEKTRSVVEK